MKVFELESDSERDTLFSWLIENSNGTSTLEDHILANTAVIGSLIVIKGNYEIVVYVQDFRDRGAEESDKIDPGPYFGPEAVPEAVTEAEEFYKRDLRARLATAIPTHNSIDELEAKFQWVWNGTVA